jgi:hypothetical protein
MLETLLVTLVATIMASAFTVGVTKEIVIPVAKEIIEVTTEGVEKAVDYVLPEKPEE